MRMFSSIWARVIALEKESGIKLTPFHYETFSSALIHVDAEVVSDGGLIAFKKEQVITAVMFFNFHLKVSGIVARLSRTPLSGHYSLVM
jgi:hypothetical protein